MLTDGGPEGPATGLGDRPEPDAGVGVEGRDIVARLHRVSQWRTAGFGREKPWAPSESARKRGEHIQTKKTMIMEEEEEEEEERGEGCLLSPS